MRDALLLGASGSLGRPLAETLLARGWRVTAVDMRQIRDFRGTEQNGRFFFERMDLTDADAVERLARGLQDSGRMPDAVILLAALHIQDNEPYLDYGLFRSVIETNMMSVFHLLSTFLPLLDRPAKFVFCSSGVVIFPNPCHLGYYLGKLAVTRAFDHFDRRYRRHGFRFKTAILGPLASPMLDASKPPGPLSGALRRLTTGKTSVAAERIVEFLDDNRTRLYYRKASAVVLWASRLVQAVLPASMKFYQAGPRRTGRVGKEGRLS